MKIRLVVTGRNYNLAEQLPPEVELNESATTDDALKLITSLLGDAELPATCLVTVAGQHLGTLDNHQPRELREGDELVLIAPVAGG